MGRGFSSSTKHPDMRRRRLYAAVGTELRRRRAELGIEKEAAADACGVTVHTIEKVESGETACPLHLLVSCADLFDCSLDELVPILTDEEGAAA